MFRKLICMLLTAIPVFAQQFVDAPRYMALDTMVVNSRITRDIYFNPTGNAGPWGGNAGCVDIDLYAATVNTVGTSEDTITIEVYGLKRKWLESTATYPTVMVGDSMNVGTMALSNTYVFNSINLESLYTLSGASTFEMFDGMRMVFKKGGSDADTVYVYNNFRMYQLGK